MNNQQILFPLGDFLNLEMYIQHLENNRYNEAIEFLNSHNNVGTRILFIQLLYNKIIEEINESLNSSSPNYKACHDKIKLLQKINNKSNELEAGLLNRDGVIFFKENNFKEAFSLFMEALNKTKEINEIFSQNLYNAFLGLFKILIENKNFQQISNNCKEILNAPNTNFKNEEKISIKYIDFVSNIRLKNFSYSENLAEEIIKMISSETFEEKKYILSEISIFYYDSKKDINRAYEIINLIEPNKDPYFLIVMINLSAIKIKSLLNENMIKEAQEYYDKIKSIELEENTDENNFLKKSNR